jgi:hypothetical protein
MTDDFIDMLMKCEEIIPHEMNKLINRITKLKEVKKIDENNGQIPTSVEDAIA